MNYTKKQRAAMVDALKAAKRVLRTPEDEEYHVSNYKSIFICHALDMVRYRHPEADTVKHLITYRLRPQSVVTGWLQKTTGIRLTPKGKQEYRHLWVDELIREFSK